MSFVDQVIKENGKTVNGVLIYNNVAPEIKTTLVDRATEEHIASLSDKAELVDTVSYTATTNQVPDTFWNIETMQQMTSEICAAATTPSASATVSDTDASHVGDTSYVPQRTLSDIRDGNTYTVRKLADGNCWMSQNMRIANVTLHSTDSEVASDITLPNISSAVGSDSATVSYITADPSSNDGGRLYNFHAASAYASGTTVLTNTSPATSLCPKNWEIPAVDGDKSFYNLVISNGNGYRFVDYSNDNGWTDPAQHTFYYVSGYGVSKMLNAPISMPYTGLANTSGTTAYQHGHYWTKTSYTNERAYYYWYDNNTSNDPKHGYPKINGMSVRCVAK